MNREGQVLLVFLLLAILPTGQTVQGQEIGNPGSDYVDGFWYNGEDFIRVVASPTYYTSVERNFTLSNFTIDTYDAEANKLRTVQIPQRYESFFIEDISDDYIVFSYQNDTDSFSQRKIINNSGINIIEGTGLEQTNDYGDFAQIYNDTVQISGYDETVTPSVFTIELYNLTNGQLLDTDHFQIDRPEQVPGKGERRGGYYSNPRPINSTSFSAWLTSIYYSDDTGSLRQMVAKHAELNTETGHYTVKEFSSGVCDNTFSDKMNEFDSISYNGDPCNFFVDWWANQIYFTRQMTVEGQDGQVSLVFISNGESEVAIQLNRYFEFIEPWGYLTSNESVLELFFFQYEALWEGEFAYVNLKIDFEKEDFIVRQGSQLITPTYNVLVDLTPDFNNFKLYSATVDSVSVEETFNIAPQNITSLSPIPTQSTPTTSTTPTSSDILFARFQIVLLPLVIVFFKRRKYSSSR